MYWRVSSYCNLFCEYCISKKSVLHNGTAPGIDVPAVIKTLDSTGKTFLFSFGGAEPFLVPNFVELCIELTKKHYIFLITNLTSEKIKEFSEKADPTKVEHIIASLHIKALEKTGLTNSYIDNFLLLKERGFHIAASEVAYPAYIDKIDEFKSFFKNRGIDCIFEPYVGTYDSKIYPEAYTPEEITKFGIRVAIENENPYQKGQLCNAGYNILVTDQTGRISKCPKITEYHGHIYKEMLFDKKLTRCPLDRCTCPLSKSNKHLLDRAIQEMEEKEKAG